jgi:hypothetical protein
MRADAIDDLSESRMKPVTVHIGFTKAASTYLQAFFHAHPEIHFPDRTAIYQLFAKENPIFFNRSHVEKYILEQWEIAGRRALVCSHERLSGCPHSGFYDCAIIANNLCAAAAPKVIIVIREQYDIICSCYREYLLNGGTRTFKEYVFPPRDGRLPLFDWKPLRYLELIELYRANLGKESIKVVLFERVSRQWQAVRDELAEFIGVSPLAGYDPPVESRNPGVPDSALEAVRTMNMTAGLLTSVSVERHSARITAGTPLTLHGSHIGSASTLGVGDPAEQRPLRDQLREWIPANEFAESNARLSKLLDVDLASEGYVI